MPRKRTHEEFLQWIREKRPDYEALSCYENNSTKIKLKHSCGTEFEMTPGHFLRGQGCPVCAQKMRNKKLSADTPRKLFMALDNLGLSLAEPLEEYQNTRQKILVRCERCGATSYKTVGSILTGHGCKHCASRDCQPTYDILARLGKDAPEWELVGEYVNMRTPTIFLHKPCGRRYTKIPMNVFAKPDACKFCNAKRLSGTHEAFLDRTKNKADYEVLSDYINSNTKVHIRHKTCGHDFWCWPQSFIKREEGCPFCKNRLIAEKRLLDPKIFENFVASDAQFELLSEYKGQTKPIEMRHKKCGEVFTTTPYNFCRSRSCPHCKASAGEQEMYEFVCSLVDEPVIQEDQKHLPFRRELDIYLPERNLAFEYDGVFHHSTYGLRRSHPKWDEARAATYSLWKTEESRKQGIRLVHIFEDEWIEKRPIVEDKIRAVLHIPQRRLFARKLTLQPIPYSEADVFYDKNHIQGKTKYSVSIGLFNGTELVAVQSFKKGSRRKEHPEGSWELVRYATTLGTVVVGGFSRCLKWFERAYSPREVVSFADLRICDPEENVYEKCGFHKDSISKPDYYYVKGLKRYHKAGFRKQTFKSKYPKTYSPDKTEQQMASELGLLKIYDCGKIRYVKTY